MKKTIVAGFVIFLLSASSVFANNIGDVNQNVLANFNKEFANAREVDWSIRTNLIKVTFRLNDQVYFAFYTKEGERVALARNILSNQLPLGLHNEIRESYNGYWISDLFEVAKNGITSYYITLENADSKMVLRSTGGSDWKEFKTVKKS